MAGLFFRHVPPPYRWSLPTNVVTAALARATVATASGVAVVSGTGAQLRQSTATAGGVSTVSGVAAATITSTFGLSEVTNEVNPVEFPKSGGFATVLGVGFSTTLGAGVGSVAGVGAANGVGRPTVAATGLALGAGAVSGTGRAIAATTATASGVAVVSATGGKTNTSVGTAAGVGAAAAAGQSVNASAFAVTDFNNEFNFLEFHQGGFATVSAVGASTLIPTAVGLSSGVGAAAAVGAVTALAVATAAGIGTASGAALGTVAAIGTAAGVVIIGAVGRDASPSLASTAVAVGSSTAHAVGFSINAGAVGRATELTVSLSAKDRAIYTALAADAYRMPIQPPPGAGPVLGVVAMAFGGIDHVYAFRATFGNTAVLVYRSSPQGWVLVPFHNIVTFTAGGTAVPLDGDTLTQGGVTATIQRVMWQSGAWAGSAVGQFVVTSPVGGNFAAGVAHTSSGATVTLIGAQTPITLAAGGRFEFIKCNFSGQLVTRRIYGCDGVNRAFEFDGTTLVPIATGNVPDRPSHIWFHKNFLFLSQDASLFFSAAGDPFKWSAVDGAGEIATGDTVTGMITLPGSQTTATLGVYLRTNTAFLYGTDPTNFNFVTFNNGIGAAPYSIQNLFDTFFLDNLGVVTLKTTLNWGNFLPSTLTKNILPFIQRERGNLVASSVKREKSQYRLFFSDGYGLYCTIHNQQYMGSLPVLFPDPMTCVDTTNLVTDEEATYTGSQSGYVFQLDKGTSFDGEDISAYMVTAWDPIKSPRVLKRFRAASIEVQGDSYAGFNYGYQIGYDSTQLAQLPGTDLPLNFAGVPLWDSFVWDEFVWDGEGLSPTDIDETGTAENVRVTITSGTNYIASYTVDSIIHHYSMRRGMRV